MDNTKTASIFGSTGLVGTALVESLINDKRYKSIYLANRSPKKHNSNKIREVLVDFDSLENYQDLFRVDEVFVCLGTTIKKAGSQEKFKLVDYDLPLQIAKLSKAANVDRFIMITALGADANSSNFYMKTKGEAEQDILKLELNKSFFVQPSLLMGKRKEKRTAERIAIWWMKRLDFLLVGPLRKYRGISDKEVAHAMLQLANYTTEKHFYQSDELKNLAEAYKKTYEHT